MLCENFLPVRKNFENRRSWSQNSSGIHRYLLPWWRLVGYEAKEDYRMARSIRFIRRNVQGRVRQNVNFSPIRQRSAVVITAAELGPGGRPHLGEANVFVTNVGPHDPEGG